jgi:hypothetical protein
MFEVTMTATRRPELLKRTLSTFQRRMFKGEMKKTRLFINVDPVGDDINSWDVVRVADEYFGEVVARCPYTPHFPTAFKWCWSMTNAQVIFNLEEDWECLTDIDFNYAVELMNFVEVLRLSFAPCSDFNKSWNHFIPWNGRYYEVPEDRKGLLGFSGNPSFISRRFVNVALTMIDGVGNPEKQLKWRPGHELQNYKYGVYGYPGMPAAVLDIGRDWKIRNGWMKVDNNGSDNKAFFTRWEKVDGQRAAGKEDRILC